MIIDLYIDFEKRTVTNILPSAFHSSGFIYQEMQNDIDDGKGVIISIEEEDIEVFGKDGYEEIPIYGEDSDILSEDDIIERHNKYVKPYLDLRKGTITL